MDDEFCEVHDKELGDGRRCPECPPDAVLLDATYPDFYELAFRVMREHDGVCFATTCSGVSRMLRAAFEAGRTAEKRSKE